MLKTIFEIKTPTQTINIPADDGKGAAIQSCTLTECVNRGEDLTLGSTCANSLEATLMLVDGDLAIQAGDIVMVSKQLDNNTPTQVGVFVLEKPTRATANTMKIVGYDNVSKLDKDLTLWLSKLEGWPYKLTEFAKLVCEDGCKITFNVSDVPNGDFEIYQFSRSSVTGRQIMQWLGEICCRFCRANANGEIEFAWYTDSGKTFSASGEKYYFQNSLTYEDFSTYPIKAVQIRLADGENGVLWPLDIAEDANSYIITGNPIINGRVTDSLLPVLENIREELASVRYTPCKVAVPACLDVHAGNTVKITDKNGKTFTTYVMTKTQKGQQDTLECTGNYRRDSSSAVNNQSVSSAGASAAKNAFDSVTSKQLFDKLTDNGRIQGIFSRDGHWVINASVAEISNFAANMITAGTLKSKDEKTFYLDLDKGVLKMEASEFSVKGKTVQEIADAAGEDKAKAAVDGMGQMDVFNKLFDNGKVQGFKIENGKLYINGQFANIENLSANTMVSGRLQSKDGYTFFDLEDGTIVTKDNYGRMVEMVSGAIACRGSDNNINAILTSGALMLGACGIFGDEDTLRFTTHHADLKDRAIFDAVWKEIIYVDEHGVSHKETFLVAR